MTLGLSEAPGLGRLLIESRFSVPSHQRDYSWTEDEVRELIDDVTEAMKNPTIQYFVGLMVFLGDDAANLTVLDGQQRLATVVIVCSAIRGWLNHYPDYRQDADDIQRDYIGKRALGQKHIEPRITMNLANAQAFSDLIVQSSSPTDIDKALTKLKKRDRNRRMLEAARYAHARVKEIADSYAEPKEAAAYFFEFVDYLRDKVSVVKLIVPDETMAYTIFETLNDRGLQLSPLDLVKNHLFSKSAAHSQARLKLMEDRWTQMMQTLSNVRSDAFLKAFWTSRHGRIRTRKLFATFKSQYVTAEAANNLSIDMLGGAEQYAALEVSDDPIWAEHPEDTKSTIQSLKIIGSQQVHPVMLSALARMSVSETERVLRLLEVCIVRYLLIGVGNTGRFETTCAVLARKIYAGEITTATAAFAELRDVYPKDDEFKQAFRTKREDHNQKAQYFLRKIEIEAARVAGGHMPGELDPGSLTVEHVLPKTPGNEWETEVTADPEFAEECTFRLGNLCLLTEVNRKLGRKSFAEKKKVFATRVWTHSMAQ